MKALEASNWGSSGSERLLVKDLLVKAVELLESVLLTVSAYDV